MYLVAALAAVWYSPFKRTLATMRIESGPTLDQRVRLGVFLLMALFMGGYFLYDGFVGYPNDNLDKVKQALSQDLDDQQREALQYRSEITLEALRRVEKEWKASTKQAETMGLADVREQLGEPSAELPGCYHYEGREIIAHFYIDGEGKVGKKESFTIDNHKSTFCINMLNLCDSRKIAY